MKPLVPGSACKSAAVSVLAFEEPPTGAKSSDLLLVLNRRDPM